MSSQITAKFPLVSVLLEEISLVPYVFPRIVYYIVLALFGLLCVVVSLVFQHPSCNIVTIILQSSKWERTSELYIITILTRRVEGDNVLPLGQTGADTYFARFKWKVDFIGTK